MSLNLSQETCLFLAGTVALPAPYPEIGLITYKKAEASRTGDMVYVQLQVSSRRSITWAVRLSDVEAYCRDPSAGPVEKNDENWKLGKDAHKLLQELEDTSIKGIIHVKENAQVFLQIDMGVTAAESIQAFLGVAAPLGCCPHDAVITQRGCCPHD